MTVSSRYDDDPVYRLPQPQPDGRAELRLTPLELIERLAAIIPPPQADPTPRIEVGEAA